MGPAVPERHIQEEEGHGDPAEKGRPHPLIAEKPFPQPAIVQEEVIALIAKEEVKYSVSD